MRLHRPSPAIVAGALAVAVATAGSATAASLITSSQIKDGTIQMRDISKRAQLSLKGQTGPAGMKGPAGVPGAQGPAGAQGPPGMVTMTRVNGTWIANPPNTQVGVVAVCPPSAPNVVGGGVMSSSDAQGVQSVNSSAPDYADATHPTDRWLAFVDNGGTTTEGAGAYAICIKATSVSTTGPAAMMAPAARR
jgi:hypothetical protein